MTAASCCTMMESSYSETASQNKLFLSYFVFGCGALLQPQKNNRYTGSTDSLPGITALFLSRLSPVNKSTPLSLWPRVLQWPLYWWLCCFSLPWASPKTSVLFYLCSECLLSLCYDVSHLLGIFFFTLCYDNCYFEHKLLIWSSNKQMNEQKSFLLSLDTWIRQTINHFWCAILKLKN